MKTRPLNGCFLFHIAAPRMVSSETVFVCVHVFGWSNQQYTLTALRWKSTSATHVFLEFFSWPKYLQNNERTTRHIRGWISHRTVIRVLEVSDAAYCYTCGMVCLCVCWVGAELYATNRVPRWRIGELPSDMKVSCELSRYCTWRISSRGPAAAETPERRDGWRVVTLTIMKYPQVRWRLCDMASLSCHKSSHRVVVARKADFSSSEAPADPCSCNFHRLSWSLPMPPGSDVCSKVRGSRDTHLPPR